MNSIIKRAAKITEELSKPNEKNDAKQNGIQHIKARLGESLKKNGKTKYCKGSALEILIDSLLVKKTRSSGYRRET